MHKDTVKSDLIVPHLKAGEELIGFFMAGYQPKLRWYFLAGPFAALKMRMYFAAVTPLGIHLHKMNFWGKPESHEFVPYSNMSKLKIGKGLLQARFEISTAAKTISLKAQLKGVEKVAKLDHQTREFLRKKASLIN